MAVKGASGGGTGESLISPESSPVKYNTNQTICPLYSCYLPLVIQVTQPNLLNNTNCPYSHPSCRPINRVGVYRDV
jgi:hypothetical protein